MTCPLDLPEIRHYVAEHLLLHTLAICIRVSKDWKASFEPWIWCKFTVHRRPSDTETSEMVSTLRSHAHWIQHLDCWDESMDWIPDDLTFPGLRALSIEDHSTYNSMKQVRRHGAVLTRLHIQAAEHAPWYKSAPSKFWEAIHLSCPMLVELAVQKVVVLDNDLPCAMAFWSRLRTLRLQSVRLPYSDEAWSTIDAMKLEVKIQHLELLFIQMLSGEMQLRLMKRCPQLKSFSWGFTPKERGGWEAMGLLANALMSGDNDSSSSSRGPDKEGLGEAGGDNGEEGIGEDEDFGPIILPHLVEVEVSSAVHNDYELKRFLKTRARVPFQGLAIDSDFWGPMMPFGMESWRQIQGYHLKTITRLKIPDSNQLMSPMRCCVRCQSSNILQPPNYLRTMYWAILDHGYAWD